MSDTATIIAGVVTGICAIVAAYVASIKGREKTIHSKNDQSDSDSQRSSTPPTPPYEFPPSKPPVDRRKIYFRAFVAIAIGILISMFIPFPLSWAIIIGIAIWPLLTIVRSAKR